MADNEQILTTEHAEKEKLETDPMYKLDHGGKDKEKLKRALPSLSELQDHQSGWKNDFQLNSTLRKKFRTEKKVFAELEEKDNAVRMRTNLSIPLLPEKEEDKRLAALLTFQAPDSYEDQQHHKRREISSRSWFNSSSSSPGGATVSLLQRLGQQGKEAAVAKALSPSQSPLIRRRISTGTKSEPTATVTSQEPDSEGNTVGREKNGAETEGKASKEMHNGQMKTEEKQIDSSFGRGTSLVVDYSDSDSDCAQ